MWPLRIGDGLVDQCINHHIECFNGGDVLHSVVEDFKLLLLGTVHVIDDTNDEAELTLIWLFNH